MDGLDRGGPARAWARARVWRLTGAGELERGARAADPGTPSSSGFGVQRDLDRCEDYGAVGDADPGQVSERAMERGLGQVGSLGSGNHFLEVQAVEEVYDEAVAAAFGLRAGQICVMIHCGSRGLGHQICTDYVRAMEQAMARYGINVPDRQLACAPVSSPEGRAYLGAMAAAANYARANRQLLAHAARQVFDRVAGCGELGPRLRRVAQPRQDGDAPGRRRAAAAVRAPQGCHPGLPARATPTCPTTCAAAGSRC